MARGDGKADYFELLCQDVLVNGSAVYIADLEGPTNSFTNAERKVRVLKMPNCGGHFSFRDVASLVKPNSPNAKFIYYAPLQKNFAGIDAIMYPPLLLFQYSVNGQRSTGKDMPLLEMLCTFVRKYDLDSGAAKQRMLFFFVVPDELLLKFHLVPSSTIAPFLAEPRCRCPDEVPSPKPKTVKRSLTETDTEASGSRQVGTPCWYCRCLKYFHFHVMGIPGFLQEPKEVFRGLVPEEITIDDQGAFRALETPTCRPRIDDQGAFQPLQKPLDPSVSDVSEQLGSVAIQSDQPAENMPISD